MFPCGRPWHFPPPHTIHQDISSRLQSVPEASPQAAIDALQDSRDAVERLHAVIVERDERYAQALAKRYEWVESPNKENLVEPEIPEKQNPPFTLTQIIPHVPQHDAESVFWLLWFLLARANPVSPVREANEHEMNAYREYCVAIFTQRFDFFYDNDSRSVIYFLRDQLHSTLDPALSHLETMLNLMRDFLNCSTIVWGRYDASPYHAHTVMKGLLLVEILRLSGTDGIPLDTSQPRRAFWKDPSSPTFGPAAYNLILTDDELEQGPPRKRRRPDDPVWTYRRMIKSSESMTEFEALERSKEEGAGEEWKPWLEMCYEAADRLVRENAVAALWFGD
jgi:hypothetical protein